MNTSVREILEEHRLEAFLGAVALGVIALNHGDIRDYMAANSQLRQSVATTQAEVNEQLAQAVALESFHDLANLRYDGYCEAIFNLNSEGTYTALTPGQAVIKGDTADQFRNNPAALKSLSREHVLPAGVPVCDAYGNTALIEESEDLPVIGAIAATNDKARIEQFIVDNGGNKELSAL